MGKQKIVDRVGNSTNLYKIEAENDSKEYKNIFVNRLKFFLRIAFLALFLIALLILTYYVGAILSLQSTGENNLVQKIGAGGFGAIIGWYVYYINRYRSKPVLIKDLVTIIFIFLGGIIVQVIAAGTDLYLAYVIGFFVGLFGYFFALLAGIYISNAYTVDWFLDGRRSSTEHSDQK